MTRISVILGLFLALGITSPATMQAQTPAKVYLKLGADPQDKNRQPVAGKEHVVILDDEICDSGWGSGSGKKVAGCYPAHSAAIVNNETGEIVAMYVCGNEPSDKHKAVGKIVPDAMLVYVPVPGPQGLPGKDGVGQPGPRGPQGPAGRTPSAAELQREIDAAIAAENDDNGGFPGWAKVVIAVGAAAALTDLGIHVFGNHDHDKPGGTTNPATDGVCTNPMATNYKKVGACTFGPGGDTKPATSRAKLALVAAVRNASPYVGHSNGGWQIGLSVHK